MGYGTLHFFPLKFLYLYMDIQLSHEFQINVLILVAILVSLNFCFVSVLQHRSSLCQKQVRLRLSFTILFAH